MLCQDLVWGQAAGSPRFTLGTSVGHRTLQQGARRVHECYLSLVHFCCKKMETTPLTRVRHHGKEADGGDEEIDGHDRRPRNRDSDTTIKGPRSNSLRRGSIIDGRSASPAHGTRRRKAYGALYLLLSSMHPHFCSEGRERRGTNPLAIPGPEAELRGVNH